MKNIYLLDDDNFVKNIGSANESLYESETGCEYNYKNNKTIKCFFENDEKSIHKCISFINSLVDLDICRNPNMLNLDVVFRVFGMYEDEIVKFIQIESESINFDYDDKKFNDAIEYTMTICTRYDFFNGDDCIRNIKLKFVDLLGRSIDELTNKNIVLTSMNYKDFNLESNFYSQYEYDHYEPNADIFTHSTFRINQINFMKFGCIGILKIDKNDNRLISFEVYDKNCFEIYHQSFNAIVGKEVIYHPFNINEGEFLF